MNYARTAIVAAVAALVSAAPAAATTFTWDQGGDGDVWSQPVAATTANFVQFFGEDTSYGEGLTGPMAHSHGQDLNWTITATIDGTEQVIFTQFLTNNAHFAIRDLGKIFFTQGSVTSIGFGCDNCSGNTYHQFSDTSFTLDVGVPGVPEPATWALMIGGFGMVGAAARRRRTVVAA